MVKNSEFGGWFDPKKTGSHRKKDENGLLNALDDCIKDFESKHLENTPFDLNAIITRGSK